MLVAEGTLPDGSSTPMSGETSSTMDEFTDTILFFSNDFPNDDLKGLFATLQQRARDSRFRNLATFLSECTVVVKEEIAKLPDNLRNDLPPFQSIPAIAAYYTSYGPGHGCSLAAGLEGVLLVALQIGMLIGHYESKGLTYTLPQPGTHLAGLSIGLFSAAAVSMSASISDLTITGPECARCAFRLGVHVERVSQLLEPRVTDGKLESWVYVVTGMGVDEIQQELDNYNFKTANPEICKVFISAADKNSVSVTGPPSRLKRAFLSSNRLRYSKHAPLPVYSGLCHASHLYNTADVESIVRWEDPSPVTLRKVVIPVFSPQNGTHFQASNSRELLEAMVSEILTGSIYTDSLTDGIVNSLSSASQCHFLQLRMSNIAKGVITTLQVELSQISLQEHDLINWTAEDGLAYCKPTSVRDSKLAIVGMSCRLPGGANNLEQFWDLLMDKRDVHTTVPSDRFDLETHFDPTGVTPNSTQTPYGNFIDNPGFFDAAFFNMSPREAETTDPMHRLALVTAYEALEMAGFSPNRTPSTNCKRFGTFYGVAGDDWREVNAGQNHGTYAVPGGERAFANGRINYFFKFSGPSFNIDTACSSGLAAVHAACASLWAGESDTVLAGGLSIITNPDNYCALGRGHFLSLTGQCKVWDKDADGYCRSDGIGSIVIKRLEDAEADNDNVLAVISSAATNHSADAISITHPHAGSQIENYKQVMHRAGVNPLDVTYVELHGTGTQAGDAVESESVTTVFAPVSSRHRPEQRLHLGACKSNIGHGEAAAGISSLIKTALIFQKGLIPPQFGDKDNVNPVVLKNIEKRNTGLTWEPTPWARGNKKRYALVNSFGAHGGNTSVLLEEAPPRQLVGIDNRDAHIISLSAKSRYSLRANAESLLQFLKGHLDTDLGDLSYTLFARRMHHSMRIAASVTSVPHAISWLESSLEEIGEIKSISSTIPPVVMMFTGQGAFYKSIGTQLYRDMPFYRTEVHQLDCLVQRLGFPSVEPYLSGSSQHEETDPSAIITQLSILVTEIALGRLWNLLGVHPSAVIGHSLGEYAAFVMAGVLSTVDAIFLVGIRASLIESKCNPSTHVMLSVRASVKTIEETCSGMAYELSCINGPQDVVISGHIDHIEGINKRLQQENIKTVVLDIPYAFHTSQMDPILDEFEEKARHVTFKPPQLPVISPLLGECVFDGKTIGAQYVRRASREPVKFVDALDAARDLGVADINAVWLEVGPHPICNTFVRNWSPGTAVFASIRRKEDNWTTMGTTIAALYRLGVRISPNEWFKPFEKTHQMLLLPSYRWNEKNYWIPYVGTWTLDKAYPKIQSPQGKERPLNLSSTFQTSSIQNILLDKVYTEEAKAEVETLSDLKHPSLFPSVEGHNMNGFGVATSSIWADMALTVGEYIYKRLVSDHDGEVAMNIVDMEVLHAQVVSTDKSTPHLIRVRAECQLADPTTTTVTWHHVEANDTGADAPFASCTVLYEDPKTWQREWSHVTHLVQSRIDELDRLAATGEGGANRLSRNMAYNLFRNVVDYSETYRGMQSVVMQDFEAVADVSLGDASRITKGGIWHSPPHCIDSIFHVGGLVLNGSDASNTRDFFYVTPGWGSCRMLRRFRAGDKFRSYVRMSPMASECGGKDENNALKNMFAGDVYVLQDGEVVAMLRTMKFRRVPRTLMDRFFSLSAVTSGAPAHAGKTITTTAMVKPESAVTQASKGDSSVAKPFASGAQPMKEITIAALAAEAAPVVSKSSPSDPVSEGIVCSCMKLISRETGLTTDQLQDDATFVELGVDSLMSLVLSEKLRDELSLDIKSSLFLECSDIKALKEWLLEYC
ncbi:Type I Iterative PKS [Microsporum canis]